MSAYYMGTTSKDLLTLKAQLESYAQAQAAAAKFITSIVTGVFNSAIAWTVLNLSSHVGSNVAFVLLRISPAATIDIAFETYGNNANVGKWGVSYFGAGVNGASIDANGKSHILVKTDNLGRIQHTAGVAGVAINWQLVGYFKA